ncbi:MAG TPA: ModD protein [Rhodospirillales bacterium]|nr:ModD protein [Rhodospirillales bacterium]
MILADALIDGWLAEDVPLGDLTTDILGIGSNPARLRFASRAGGVVCCLEEAERLLVRQGIRVQRLRDSGDTVAVGDLLLRADGAADALLRTWKTAQTLIEQTSGIASAARRIVTAARAVAPGIAVECTRKSMPGARALSVRAVLAGGAGMHRLGLSESILIFPEHAVLHGGWSALLARVPALKRAQPGHKIMAEAKTRADALALAEAGIDVVQVDKLPPDAVRDIVEQTRHLAPSPAIAAAGGIDEHNAGAYAATGCAVLVTSAPYWARPADVQVTVEPV